MVAWVWVAYSVPVATWANAINRVNLVMEVMHERNAHNFLLDLVATATPVALTALAFWLSFASGLAEPLGALLGYVLLRSVLTPLVIGVVFASVGGVMIYICLDELLPAAQRCGTHHQMIAGVIAGMVVMSTSLLFLA
jgi:ZIP family zinc transporter